MDSYNDGNVIEESAREYRGCVILFLIPIFTALHVRLPKLATLQAQSLLVLFHLVIFMAGTWLHSVTYGLPVSVHTFICSFHYPVIHSFNLVSTRELQYFGFFGTTFVLRYYITGPNSSALLYCEINIWLFLHRVRRSAMCWAILIQLQNQPYLISLLSTSAS